MSKFQSYSVYGRPNVFSFLLFGSNTSSLLIFKGLCSSVVARYLYVLCPLFSPPCHRCSLLVQAVWRMGRGPKEDDSKKISWSLPMYSLYGSPQQIPQRFLIISQTCTGYCYHCWGVMLQGYVEKQRCLYRKVCVIGPWIFIQIYYFSMVTFLSNRIVFDWLAVLSGWGRTGENLAAQRISRRRTDGGWIVPIVSGHDD